MEYNSFVLKRIPQDVKNKNKLAFGMLLSIIRENAIRTTEQLNNFIYGEIDAARRWLAQNKTAPTMNRLRREMVQKLEYLNRVKGLSDAYLK
ncbi:MAG: hypothetical protein ABIH63_04330 [archaeon]